MANLDLIKKLNEEYGKSSKIRRETKLFSLKESLDPGKIEKALPDALSNMGPSYTSYFDLGLPADVTLLFIDICDFSTRYSHFEGEQIADYFDQYYDIVIPIIYKYGGEIDKIMGDGIICVFGPPYLENILKDNIRKGNDCAKEIIKKTKGTKFSSKIAFHSGTINYFKNKTGLYKEFTMIGKPLTEIFRLESVSFNERINYYSETDIREFYEERFNNSLSSSGGSGIVDWSHTDHLLPKSLKGIDYTDFHTIKYNK